MQNEPTNSNLPAVAVQPTETNSKNFNLPSVDRVGKYVFTGLLVVGSVFAIRAGIRKIRANNAGRNIEDVSVQHATRLRNAFNPSGTSWLISTDGTKEQEIFNIAQEIKAERDKNNSNHFQNVSKTYQRLYSDNLTDRLQKELSAAEYRQFLSVISGESQASESPVTIEQKEILDSREQSAIISAQRPVQMGDVVITITNARLRTSPRVEPLNPILRAVASEQKKQEGANFIVTVPQNRMIHGIPTKTMNDGNGRVWLEISALVQQKGNKPPVNRLVYVTRENVRLVNRVDFDKQFKSTTPIFYLQS